MRQSVALRVEPTLRQAKKILTRLQGELTERGAEVELVGHEELHFRVPAPWRASRLGWLAAVTSGEAHFSAGGGGPWKLRYRLNFTVLRTLCLALTALLVFLGWRLHWARETLIPSVVGLWALLFLPLYLVATTHFYRSLRRAAREVIERRATPRTGTNSGSGPVVATDEHEAYGPDQPAPRTGESRDPGQSREPGQSTDGGPHGENRGGPPPTSTMP